MDSNVVDLADLPMEILEKIVSNLRPEEICSKIRLVSQRFQEAAYNVMRSEFLAVQPLIEAQLNKARRDLQTIVVTTETFQQEMILVAKFTFLQVVYSEYRILYTLFFQTESLIHSAVIFKAVKNLDEFYNLLNNANLDQWDWRTNVSAIIDKLRQLNSEVCDEFFWKNWDIAKNPFGPLLLRILGCAICSKYQVAVCHETNPQFSDSKCRLSGQFEIPDLSSTLSPLPSGARRPQDCTRVLAAYICDSVRWGNLFHTLRLRWLCMDRALALGRRQTPGWPLLDPNDPYLNNERHIVSENEVELRNSKKKICRIIEKAGEDTRQIPLWLGMRFDFKLWCPIKNAPEEMFKPGEYREYLRLKEGAISFRPYLFKLEFRVYVKAVSYRSQGVVETAVWLEETPEGITYTQSKQLVT